jgi:hypothetical protein
MSAKVSRRVCTWNAGTIEYRHERSRAGCAFLVLPIGAGAASFLVGSLGLCRVAASGDEGRHETAPCARRGEGGPAEMELIEHA